MNINAVKIDQNTIQLWFSKFKKTPYYSATIYTIVIVVCIGVVAFIIIPQISNFFYIQQELKTVRDETSTINKNIAYVQGLDQATLDQNSQVVQNALPYQKDFIGILQAINNAAVLSNTSIDDYSFSVGKLQKNQIGKQNSTFSVAVTVDGDVSHTQKFITQIQQLLPLSQVSDFSYDGDSGKASMNIAFYYKSAAPITVDNTTPIVLRSDSKDLIQKLTNWQNSAIPPINTLPPVNGSGSASSPF